MILIATVAFKCSHIHLSLSSDFLPGKVTLALHKLHFCKHERINLVHREVVWLRGNFLWSHGCIYFSGVFMDGICWVLWTGVVAVTVGSLHSVPLVPLVTLTLCRCFLPNRVSLASVWLFQSKGWAPDPCHCLDLLLESLIYLQRQQTERPQAQEKEHKVFGSRGPPHRTVSAHHSYFFPSPCKVI